jgi:hypothetical protein
MDRATFWQLIDAARHMSQGSCAQHAEALMHLLVQQEPDEIIAFDRIFDQVMAEAYDYDLWGAAYVINGGCSDDCFEYFRGWLIAHGEAIYRAALHDPDSLVPFLDPDEAGAGGHECEELHYAARDAYEERVGSDMPAGPAAALALTGEQWSEDDLPRRFPKLATACGWND